jgi:SAM-dependent methyltransferase
MTPIKPAPLRCPCDGRNFRKVFTYTAPPAGEVRFDFAAAGNYRREVWRCAVCHHFVSICYLDMSGLYQHDYVSATYGDREGLRRAFERINSLGPDKSDNLGRVQRLLEFALAHLPGPAREKRSPTVLDVGSGLCVFLHRMKEAGWECTALDNDPRLVAHAQEAVGVKALLGDFLELKDLGQFDLVTFNKVLEHVVDPVAMLARSAANLRPGGFVYVEVPDGEAAAQEGPEREEFFIEHHHIFSPASLALLAGRAGFAVRQLERLREPSTKYTLRAFLRPARDRGSDFTRRTEL